MRGQAWRAWNETRGTPFCGRTERGGSASDPRRAAEATRPPVACGSGSHLLDRDAELPCLVDEVVGDAAAGERDHALGQEVEEVVVAAERSGPSVAVPVGLAHDLVDAALLGPTCRDALDAGAAAVDPAPCRCSRTQGPVGSPMSFDDYNSVGYDACRSAVQEEFGGQVPNRRHSISGTSVPPRPIDALGESPRSGQGSGSVN